MAINVHKLEIDAGDGNYESGDIVSLISGGPDMTVLGVCEDCGEVEVAWFNYDEEFGFTFYNESFPAVCLELAS